MFAKIWKAEIIRAGLEDFARKTPHHTLKNLMKSISGGRHWNQNRFDEMIIDEFAKHIKSYACMEDIATLVRQKARQVRVMYAHPDVRKNKELHQAVLEDKDGQFQNPIYSTVMNRLGVPGFTNKRRRYSY